MNNEISRSASWNNKTRIFKNACKSPRRSGFVKNGSASQRVTRVAVIRRCPPPRHLASWPALWTTSYFHDSTEPPACENGHISPGYLWNRRNDNFTINKVKLDFREPAGGRPAAYKFDVAYRAPFIAGQDAPIVNSGSGITGVDYLREAYLELNVPIGTGLNVRWRAGETASVLLFTAQLSPANGGAANDNFPQGFQWFYTGNGRRARVQLGYDFTDMIGVKARVQNGLYAGPVDNNSYSKTFVGAVDLKPTTNLVVPTCCGAGGCEQALHFAKRCSVAKSSAFGFQATTALSFGTEFDFFDFKNASTVVPPGNNSVWSVGLWSTYAFTDQLALAFRGEFLRDAHGADISGVTARRWRGLLRARGAWPAKSCQGHRPGPDQFHANAGLQTFAKGQSRSSRKSGLTSQQAPGRTVGIPAPLVPGSYRQAKPLRFM